MKNSLETRIGIFVALTALAAVFILEMLGGVERFTRGHRLYALFNSVQELKVGDRVKMAGVEVGRVEKIEIEENENKVRVTMKVKKSARIKTDSVATVKFAGLLGQNFISVNFGSPRAPIADNGTILATIEQPDLSNLMAKLDSVATGVENVTKTFTGDTLNNLLGPFTDFLKANQTPLSMTIANMQSISAQVAHGEGTVGKLIFDDALYNSTYNTVSNLQFATDDIKLTLNDARNILQQINSGQGTMGRLLKDEALYNETTASMANLKEILQKMNQGQGTIGKLINDQEIYRNAKLSLQKLDKMTDELEDQGPLSVLGMAVNKLF